MAYQQPSIIWPNEFLPGTIDNFVSNEVIIKDITAEQIWALLGDCSKWESYYYNCTVSPPASGPRLQKGDVFRFSTFGFPPLTCTVKESVAPSGKTEGRIAWQVDKAGEDGIGVYHAWLVQDLEGGRVRVLTQESQVGPPAVGLAVNKPNMMLLGHQDWLDGLVKAARGQAVDKAETNLKSVGAWQRE